MTAREILQTADPEQGPAPILTKHVHPRVPVTLISRAEAYGRRHGLGTVNAVLLLALSHGMSYLEVSEHPDSMVGLELDPAVSYAPEAGVTAEGQG